MTDAREKVIVLGGGVGPMAGVAAHAKIVEAVKAADDQSHPTVLHFSRPGAVPDRTAHLFALREGRTPSGDPGLGMAEVFAAAARSLGEGEKAVGGVPCNTFHARPIFERFLAALSRNDNPIRIVHMLEETAALLDRRLGGGGGTVGVLSTTGTRISGVYDELLERHGYRAVYVPEAKQETLHRAIYDPVWGIKASSPPSDRARATVSALARELAGEGVRALLPACTELPLVLPGTSFAGLPLVDPVVALARALVREAAPDRLRPLDGD